MSLSLKLRINAPGRRVVIVGVASHWGAELARRLERDPSVEYLAGIDSAPPAVGARAHGLHRGRHPQPDPVPPAARDRGRHGGALRDPLVPRAGQAGAGPARRQRDRHPAAPCRLPADRDARALVVRGSAAIYGCEGAAPSFFTEEMARTLPLRTRFQRDASELEAYVDNFARRHPAARLLHAALPAGDRAGARLAAGPLPQPARSSPPSSASTPAFSSFTPMTPTGALEAAVAEPGPRRGQRGPVGLDLAEPHAAAWPARRRSRSPIRCSALRWSGWATAWGPAPCTGTGCGCCGSGAASTTGRLRTEIGYEPRFDAEAAARDFAAKSAGRRVGPPLHPGDLAGTARRGAPMSASDGGAAGRRSAAGRRGGRGLPAPDADRDRGRPRPDDAPRACGRRAPQARSATSFELLARRVEGDYHEDEWGFDEEFAEAVYPLFEFLYEVWWRVEADGVRTSPPTGGRSSSPTTPARCSPSTRR